jgi:elongation factor 3
MAPSLDVADSHSASNVKAENQKSLKVIDELLAKLTVSKAQDEINASAIDLATFINGDIEEADAPNK